MRTQSEDTSLAAEKVLIGLLQAATPKRKLAMVLSANRAARALAMTGLKERHPDASADDLRRRFADLWLGPELAAKAYGSLVKNGRGCHGAFRCVGEDMVIAKLDCFRKGGGESDRQWRDILGVLKVQAGRLDHEYLQHWARELDLTELLLRAKSEAGS